MKKLIAGISGFLATAFVSVAATWLRPSGPRRPRAAPAPTPSTRSRPLSGHRGNAPPRFGAISQSKAAAAATPWHRPATPAPPAKVTVIIAWR